MEVHFTIPGEPVGKGRPRFSRQGSFVKAYTPGKTVSYENLIKVEYERQSGLSFGEREIGLRVTAYFSIPKSVSKAKRQRMKDGEIRPAKKPDIDNVCKVVADALNGVAYNDDRQIVYTEISKRYDDMPRMDVSIFDM
jgi:Holliday junction resolvase RusA-like endonuclease